MSVHHVRAVPMGARRGHRTPGTGVATHHVGAGVEPRTSGGAANALNC